MLKNGRHGSGPEGPVAFFAVFLLILIGHLILFGQKQAWALFDAHGGPVKSVAVSADGRFALTASFDYSIILWDLAEEIGLVELEGHDAAVNAVTFLHGGKQALSASDDGTVALWDLADGTMLARFEGHDGKVVGIALSPDGKTAASAGWDRTVRLWDLTSLAPTQTLSWRDNMNAVRFSADGQTVIAGASDGKLVAWRVVDGTRVLAISSHDFAVTGMDYNAENGLVVTSSVDETVRLWDLATAGGNGAREPISTLFGHVGPVLCVALSANGELVASGGVDGTVRVWRRGDGDRLKVFARHQGPVWSVVFARDGETLLSGGADGLVLTYNLAHPEEPLMLDRNYHADIKAEAANPGEKVSRGEKLFKTCSACHSITPDDGHRAGPTLHGLFGRTAGSHPDYHYSEALVKSDLVWTEETIDQLFEIGPEHLLPGTKMPLQRMPDSQDRIDLIAFLKQVTTP